MRTENENYHPIGDHFYISPITIAQVFVNIKRDFSLLTAYSTDFRASAMLILSSWKYMMKSTNNAATMVSTAEMA